MRPLLLIFSLLLTTAIAAVADPSLSVNVNRDRLYLGESLLMEVKVDGADNPGVPDLAAIRNCTIEPLGSQSASRFTVVIVNGQMRKEGFSGRIFSYKLTPTSEGELITGPITAVVNGTSIATTGPTVTVTGITRQNVVVATVTASQDTVLVDEPFSILVKIKIMCLAPPFQDTDPMFPADPPHVEAEFLKGGNTDGLKGPDFTKLLSEHLAQQNQPGFTLNNFTVQGNPFDFNQMFNPQGVPARFKFDRVKASENGHTYWEYALVIPYSPLTEGSYTFGPLLFKGTIPLEVKADGSANSRPIFAVGPAAMVRVIPPPEENRPASYIGAIGSNLVAEASLDAQTCNVGDPLKLTLTISGAIQMRNITPPKLSLQSSLLDRFEIYDDTVQTVKQEGQRQYTYTLRPREAGSFELPPIEVSYYDAITRQYRTAKTLPIPLKVRRVTEITASQIIGGSTNPVARLHREEEAAMRPAGIRVGSAGAEQVSLIGNPATLALFAGTGPALFIIGMMGVLIRKHMPSVKQAQRQRRAFSRASAGLMSIASEGRPETLHPAICSLLRQYLADRFAIQAGALTPAEAQTMLGSRGIPYDLAKRFSAIMQYHFDASFGTGVAAADTQELLSMLAGIESYLTTRKRSRLSRAPLVVLLCGVCAFEASAATSAERTFIWTEALTGFSTAQTEKEFLSTAATCQKLVDLGVKNADLFYNQGTALLLAGKPTDAVAVLLRAERYGGSSVDITRNLAIAEARKQGLKTPVASWLRLVLFWHYGLSCATRTLITAMAFSLLWLAGAMGWLGLQRTGKVMRIAAATAFILFGSSVLATLQQESQATRPLSLMRPP
ncbi:MAG: BatD family protein [bacterium]